MYQAGIDILAADANTAITILPYHYAMPLASLQRLEPLFVRI
jgi:hypothetical protein